MKKEWKPLINIKEEKKIKMKAHPIKRWIISQSLNHPKRTIIFSLIITALMASGLRFFYIEEDMMKLLPENMESRKTWETIKDEFGNTEMIYIAFGNKDKSVFNDKLIADLWDFKETLESIPEIEEINSMINMNKLQSEDGFLEVEDLVQSRDLNADQISEIRSYLDKYPELKLRVVSQNNDYVNIIIKSYNDVPSDAVARIIDAAVEELNDYEVFIGGVPYVNGVVSALIREDVAGLVSIGMLIMILILLFSLRSFPAVLMVLSVIFFSLIAMMGSMGWVLEITGSRRFVFSLINTSMPIILLTIANSDGVHIITKFFKKLRQSGDTQLAVEQTMESLTLPIFLTSITTAAAFLSMIYSPLEVQTGYGVTIAIGILWALVLSYTLLPSLLVLKKWNLDSKAVRETSFLENVIDRFGKGVLENPKRVLSSGLILVFIGLIGINWLSVEVNMQSFFKEGTPIRETMKFLDREMIGTLDMQFRFEGDMKEPETLAKIEKLQNKMEENQKVTTSMSIADAIKQMHRTVMDDDPDYETIPDKRGKVNNLFTLYAMSGDPDDFSSLVDYEYSSGLMTTFMRNMTSSLIIEYVESTHDFIADSLEATDKITVTGMLVVFRDLITLIIRSSAISISISIVLIALIAGFFFKRILWGLLAVVPLMSAVILNFGFMGIFGVDLNHITAILSSIIIGVGVDFAIHYISQYRRLVKQKVSVDVLSREVVDDVGYPIILDALSNMAFGALLFSQFLPIQHMGGLMVFGMISTSVGTLTILATTAELLKHKLIKL